MNEEHENAIQFVESGEDSSKALQPTKQPFDLVAFFLQLLAIFPDTQAIVFRRQDWLHFKNQFHWPFRHPAVRGAHGELTAGAENR
jgi:hypothetical protein